MREHDHRGTNASEEREHRGVAPGKTTRTERIQRKASGTPQAGGDVTELVQMTAGSTGAALPDATRAKFEGSLGADLSGVRVHTGASSAEAAAGMGAKAFATGQDIHFAAGQYQPDDPFGMHLLAHEVAHTVQQGKGGGGGDAQTKLEVSEPGDALEHEADHAADAMVRGQAASVSAAAPGAARKVHRFLDGIVDAVQGVVQDVVQSVAAPPSNEGGGGAATGGAAGARPMLAMGSRGPAVVELQEKLGIAADGAFGPATRAAVVGFQQSKGLVADGIVGGMTWAALDGGGGAAPAASPTSAAAPAGGTAGATHTTEAVPTGATHTTEAVPAGATHTTEAVPAGATHTTEAVPAGANAAAPGEGAEPAATSGNGTRDAIVAQARSKIGLIFSNKSGGVDETGDHVRHGWEHLQEIFGVAVPSFPPQVVKYLKYGKNSDATNKNGLPSWCGIFATWAVMTAGGNSGAWLSGNRIDNMKKLTKDPKPGDVGNFEKNNHYCIIAAVNGDTIETIDGNSFDGASGGDGAVATKTRSRGEFRAFFRQVDE